MGDIAAPSGPGRNRSGSIGAWYSGSYGNITRTTRLRATPFTPGGLRPLHNHDVTIPLDVSGQGNAGLRGYGRTPANETTGASDGTNAAPGNGTTAALEANGKAPKGKGGKKGETLFGPDLGLDENESEGWIRGQNKKERVPLSVVKDWVENAKKEEQGVHQTTTLQALVNLKRPTLTLVPVSQDEIVPAETNTDPASYDPAASRASIERAGAIRHVLRFTYDSSAPRVQISVSIHPRFMNHGNSRVIFTCTREGGFGKVWELPHENALDIGQAMEDEKRAEEELLSASKKLDGDGSEGSDAEDDIKKPAQIRRETAQPNAADVNQMSAQAMIENQPRSRSLFDRIRRQRRNGDIEQGIIADIRRQQGGTGEIVEMGTLGTAGTSGGNGDAPGQENAFKDEEGLRVIIRLDALKQDDSPMSVTNAQATHVLLAGTVVGGAATASRPAVDIAGGGLADVPEEGPEVTEETVDQGLSPLKRIWFIKVVRREAIIGHHAFLLKEIYGLASSSHNDAPVASGAGLGDTNPAGEDPMASTPNECIVCLTNPRDVVLLPCRHLVVCRECAVGMIEFGAGGKVARRDEGNEASGTGEAGADGTGETGGAGASNAATGTPSAPAPATTTGGRERRKKKGKGWFCPVCRQPYTSLLRLALPANEMTTVEIDAVTSAALSRQPSIGAASVRSLRHSLHRSSSRATLPERGERMLEDIARENDHGEDADDDLEEERGERQFETDRQDAHMGAGVPPQFVLGEEVDAASRPSTTALGESRDRAPSPPTGQFARTSLEGRQSLEGRGWKEAA